MLNTEIFRNNTMPNYEARVSIPSRFVKEGKLYLGYLPDQV